MTAKRVSIVIPNYNGLEHLAECFASLREQSFDDFHVIFVDNQSADESVAFVRAHMPQADVVVMPSNGGFASAVNEGIRRSTGDYVLLLNNDTRAHRDFLRELVVALDANPQFDFAAPKMVLYATPTLINAAGDSFHWSSLRAANRGYLKAESAFSHACRVFGACAGAALYRRQFFDEVGLFDERFFLMSEDTDVNLRALNRKKRCLYVPSSQILHKHSATIKKEPSATMHRLAHRNHMFAICKNVPTTLLPAVALAYPLRLFRITFPLRPRNWKLIPKLLSELPTVVAADIEGIGMGLRSRTDLGDNDALTFLRWTLKSTGAP